MVAPQVLPTPRSLPFLGLQVATMPALLKKFWTRSQAPYLIISRSRSKAMILSQNTNPLDIGLLLLIFCQAAAIVLAAVVLVLPWGLLQPLPIAPLGQWRCTTAVDGLFVSSGAALLAVIWEEFSLLVSVGAAFFLVVALVSMLILVAFLVPSLELLSPASVLGPALYPAVFLVELADDGLSLVFGDGMGHGLLCGLLAVRSGVLWKGGVRCVKTL